jgi:hypothetical protein
VLGFLPSVRAAQVAYLAICQALSVFIISLYADKWVSFFTALSLLVLVISMQQARAREAAINNWCPSQEQNTLAGASMACGPLGESDALSQQNWARLEALNANAVKCRFSLIARSISLACLFQRSAVPLENVLFIVSAGTL